MTLSPIPATQPAPLPGEMYTTEQIHQMGWENSRYFVWRCAEIGAINGEVTSYYQAWPPWYKGESLR